MKEYSLKLIESVLFQQTNSKLGFERPRITSTHRRYSNGKVTLIILNQEKYSEDAVREIAEEIGMPENEFMACLRLEESVANQPKYKLKRSLFQNLNFWLCKIRRLGVRSILQTIFRS